MIISAYILLVFFSLFVLHGARKFYSGFNLTGFHAIMWFLSAFIVALSAGIIWGGLFQ